MADFKKRLGALGTLGKRLLATDDEASLSAIRAAGRAAHEQEAAIRAAKNAQVKEQMARLPARNKKANEALGLYHPVGGGLKLSKPTSGMHATTVADPKFNPPDIGIITPEQLVKEEAALFPLVGDRAAGGRYLTHVDENELEIPVRLTGGPRYMDANYNPITPDDSAAWESGAGRVTALGKQAERAGQGGRPVYGIYTAGSGTNTDFNIMGANALYQQIAQGKITKKAEREFDRAMKEGTKEFPPIPNWPGIRSPEAYELLLDKSNGIARTKLFGVMGKENFQSMGFPDVPATRKSIIEPELLDVPTNQAGFRLARMDTTGRIIENPNIPSDYPKAMAGKVAGRLDVPADYKDIFQSHFDARRLLSQPESGDYYSFSRAHPIQYADDAWLNRLMEQRLATERKIKEGEYKEGGTVDISEADKRLAKAIENRMAKGGEVDLEAADARLSAAIEARMGMAGGGKVKGAAKAFKKLFADEAPKAPRTVSAGDIVNGMRVREDIPNTSSIGASLSDYSTHGLQEVPMSAFDTVGKPKYYSLQQQKRTQELARQIQENKELNPLIVVKDAEGHYILEGGHRFDALRELDINSFPALMVHDLESLGTLGKANGGLAHMGKGGKMSALGKLGKRLLADPDAVTPTTRGGTRKFGNDANGLNIIKETGGNWIGGDSSGSVLGNVDKRLEAMRPYSAPELRIPRVKEKIANLESRGKLSLEHQNLLDSHKMDLAEDEKFLAINNWITKNIGNYIKKDMATANDPVRLMFEKRAQEIEQQFTVDMNRAQRTRERAEAEVDPRRKGNMMRQATEQEQQAALDREFAMQNSTHLPKGENNWGDVDAEALNQLKQQRQQAGFPPEGVAKSEPAKQWERISDEAVTPIRAGDIQKQKGALEELRLAEEAHKQKWVDIDKNYYETMKNEFNKQNIGLSDEQIRKYADLQPITDKAKLVGEEAELERLSKDMFEKKQRANQGLGMIGDQNQWINKLDPEAKVNSAYIGDLGFDHVVDIIRADVLAGRIRPEQLNKLSMEQAIKRTAEFNMEQAKKMRETAIKQTEGFPTHKEYADKGYKWIELKKPEDLTELPPTHELEPYESKVHGGTAYRVINKETGMRGEGYKTPERATSEFLKEHSEDRLAEALKYEGDTMGHCVGNYCPDVSAGRTRIYSLRDKRGEPHVTVEVQPDENIFGFRNAKENYPELYEKYSADKNKYSNSWRDFLKQEAPEVLENVPKKIVQIKGKQNASPKEDYLPFVQDFVKSGEWSQVGDLKNTGLIHREGKYLTPAEDADWLLKELGLPPTPPAEGMAEGGGAFKKLQFMGGGGITTSGGSFSPEELGVEASDLGISDKRMNQIKRNAADLWGEGKEQLEKEYKQLGRKGGKKDFALRVGSQFLGGGSDLVNLGLEGIDLIQGAIPALSKPESVMDVTGTGDRVPKFRLASDKPWLGSQQFIDKFKEAKLLGENEFPLTELVAGFAAPAAAVGVLNKGKQAYKGAKTLVNTPKKRRGGLTAMAR